MYANNISDFSVCHSATVLKYFSQFFSTVDVFKPKLIFNINRIPFYYENSKMFYRINLQAFKISSV